MASITTGKISAPTISSRYWGFYKCLEGTGTVLTDSSGKGHDTVLVGTFGTWSATPEYYQSKNSANGCTIPKLGVDDWHWNSQVTDPQLLPIVHDTLIWSARVYTPNTLASGTIFRTGTGTTAAGFFIESLSTGYNGGPGVRAKFYDNVGPVTTTVPGPLPANTWTTVGVCLDGGSGRNSSIEFSLYINGEAAIVKGFGTNPIRSVLTGNLGTATGANPFVGGIPSGEVDLKRIYGIHYLVIPESAGLIPDIPAVMRRLHQDPLLALTSAEIP
jgi:hypothetical protein